MEKLKLSSKAEGIVRKLVVSTDSEKAGYIAAVEPKTGEVFYGRTVVDAAKEGRRRKNDPKAVFFFVRVGYPAVHVLKTVTLQGYIYQHYFPKVRGYIQDRDLNLVSVIPEDAGALELIADTGFSGGLVLDTRVIQSINSDYLGEDTVGLAGGVVQQVSIYLGDVIIDGLRLKEVEIMEMKGEYLMGIAVMRSICRRAIFAFDNDEILFER